MRWGGAVGAVGLAGCAGPTDDSGESDESDEAAAGADGPSTEIDTDAAFRATLVVDESHVLFTAAEIASVGPISESERTGISMPIELTDEGTESVIETARGVDLSETYREAEIVLSLDEERINSFRIGGSLAETWASGEWEGPLVVTFADRGQAATVRERLVDGGSA